jgi:hypothetical protein
MATQCRAKDPSSCRVHGTSGELQKLQKIAASAIISGDMDLYVSTRAEMDALSDENGANGGSVISNEAAEASAKAYWDERHPGTWDNKLGDDWKDIYREDSRKELEAALPQMLNGIVTDKAVEVVAQTGWEIRDGKASWERAGTYWQSIYRTSARVSLTAAAPYLPKPSTEELTRKVLGKTYDRFGFGRDSALVSHFVSVLEDPAQSKVEDEGDASPAAEEIRKKLWSHYAGGGASASATSNLFYALGREKELGWVEEQVPGYQFDPDDFV